MSKQKAENYAFSCSLIRANERTLLTMQDLERVLDAKDMQQAMHILTEFGYADSKESEDPRGFETVLAKEMNRVSELAASLTAEKAEIELFRLPQDYHNLKVLLKAEASCWIRECSTALRMRRSFTPRAAIRRRSIWYWIGPATRRCSAWPRTAKIRSLRTIAR